ncbi:hypothetical protein UFOVP80_38 [uncultured Caudovirales phage]|jgi:hypothetical protein|uniref:Uncharacterized protein n=1 Tax=uncultured Caudovirales phage TaxID=2100421 RepID=A0A6J5L267_9CAUD|nr:hypothetical protein UFOVP80_38 [uncultured Caudovirales phage]
MKYKPCCDRRCLVAGCEINENGGCYCACRIADALHELQSILKGHTIVSNGAMVYIPDPVKRDEFIEKMNDQEKEKYYKYRLFDVPNLIEFYEKKLKEYE